MEPTQPLPKLEDSPDPAWVRGKCPKCGAVLVSHLYYHAGKGYLIEWQCWESGEDSPTCDYKVVL